MQIDENGDGKGDACDIPPDCSMARPIPYSQYGAPYTKEFIEVGIDGVTDVETSDEFITYEILNIFQNEPVCEPGCELPDARDAYCEIYDRNKFQIRRERTDRKKGRVYHIEFAAYDNLGQNCTGTINIGVGERPKRKKYGQRNRYDRTPCSWNDDDEVYDSCRGCPPPRPKGQQGPKGKNGKSPPVGDRYVRNPKRRYRAESPGADAVDVDTPISPDDDVWKQPNDDMPFNKEPISPIDEPVTSTFGDWIAENLNETMHYILFFAIVGLLVLVYRQLKKKNESRGFVEVDSEDEQEKLV